MELDGANPIDRLTDEERAKAAALMPFPKEDREAAPLDRLAAQARAALASGDRANLFQLGRYLGGRLDAERRRSPAPSPERQGMVGLFRELEDRLADPKAEEKRARAERRKSAAQVLRGRIHRTRLELDGSMARAAEEMRRRYAW